MTNHFDPTTNIEQDEALAADGETLVWNVINDGVMVIVTSPGSSSSKGKHH